MGLFSVLLQLLPGHQLYPSVASQQGDTSIAEIFINANLCMIWRQETGGQCWFCSCCEPSFLPLPH